MEFNEIYISVYCPDECNGKLTFYSSDYIHLSQKCPLFVGESDNYIFSIKIDSLPQNEAIQLTLLGLQIPLYMKISVLKDKKYYLLNLHLKVC